MPLTFARIGEERIIRKIGGNSETKKFLESLGFIAGSTVKLISSRDGDVIINVKESRIAINKDMAKVILV